MRNWGLTLVLSALAAALLAVPASAQQTDFYGEVLPDDLSQPGDTTARPDDAAAPATEEAGERPGSSAAERPESTSAADRPGPDVRVRAAGNPVTVAGRQLPVTGGELTLTLLALGGFMVAAGAAIVTVNRRRGQA